MIKAYNYITAITIISVVSFIGSLANFLIAFTTGPFVARIIGASSLICSIVMLVLQDVILTKHPQLKERSKVVIKISKILMFLSIIISLIGLLNNYGFPESNPY